jgi:hypothetical protein
MPPSVYYGCVGNHILHYRAYIEIAYCVPFLKSCKPVTEVVSAKLQQAITFEKWYTTCNFCAYSERIGVS